MPFFSIISPIYNCSKYLPNFLESIVRQDFSDYELILVDDGSTDDSLSICEEYVSKNDKIVLLSQSNQGAGSARNKGLEVACGQYILFFDSDDWVNCDILSVLYKEILGSNVELLIYGSQGIMFDKKNREKQRYDLIPKESEINGKRECIRLFSEFLFGSLLNQPWNKVYQKKIIDEYHIRFADTRRSQDAFFNMEYYKRISRIRSIGNILYYYRANDQDKEWVKFPKNMYEIDIEHDRYLVNIFKEFGLFSDRDRKKLDNNFYYALLRDAALCRNPFWNMKHQEKIEYIHTIISNSYNQNRAKFAIASDKRTEKIHQRIVDIDAEGFLKDIYLDVYRKRIYAFYANSLRKIIKGKQ